MALCPSCKQTVGHLNIQEVSASAFFSTQWRGITYSCPHCQTILSVGIDPVSLKTDTVDEILRALGKR